MNKDVVGLIHWIEYRLKIYNVAKEYRDEFAVHKNDIWGPRYHDIWSLNRRCLSRSFCMGNIYSFRTMRPVGRLPKKYW